ncbi:MAG: adenylate/guanylate cyclase domain-containing protein [Actinomycetota bacterium]|nr:nuclear transport factor 2 family protein [Actinomycetota bacterium]
MEPSDEIEQAMLETIRVLLKTGWDEAAWKAIWSARPGILSLGTDPREWWDDPDKVVSLHMRQVTERGTATTSNEKLVAFQEGSAGWAVWSGDVDWVGGQATALRVTGIFHLERAEWKLVHQHRSFAVLNEVYGVQLTTNLDTIAEEVGREQRDLSHIAAPNGTVTILFTDIERSTELTESLGDKLWMEVLREHDEIVRDHAARNEGFIVKSQGDGFMIAFRSAREALHCAMDIQRTFTSRDLGLKVRVGVHTGEAIREEDDFYGKAVILAARVAARARGGEILASSLVQQLVEGTGEFSFEQSLEIHLKGLKGQHLVAPLRWQP